MKRILLSGPLLSNSGYGVHSRQVFSYLNNLVGVKVYCNILKWGNLPWHLSDKYTSGQFNSIIKNHIPESQLSNVNFDETYSIGFPHEWLFFGKKNIGITAGVETDIVPFHWLKYINKADKVICTSNFTANPTYAGTGLAVYDCLMHENGEQQVDWFITQGQILHSGNLAVTEAGGSEEYYWEIYHLMGDPSLMTYIGVPTLLSVSHQSALPLATNTLTVTTEENAYVAISINGVLLDAQLADVTGIVNLTFPAISNIGIADIVVTKQFKQPPSTSC